MRVLLLGLGLMLSLSGCAVPTAVTIASFAADGVSYIATGKSTTDHALSVIAQEDCAMMRALEERAICTPERKSRVLTATAEPDGKYPPQAIRPGAVVKSPVIAPTVWNFPLISKETVSRADPPGSPQLVAKDIPARPIVTPSAPVRIVKRLLPRAPQRTPPPLATGRLVLGLCSDTAGMQPAAQCGLGPGA